MTTTLLMSWQRVHSMCTKPWTELIFRIRGGRRNSLQHAALSHAARVNLWPRAVIGPCLFHRRCAISLDTACTFGSCKREHTRLVR